jgi:hypothetical protein
MLSVMLYILSCQTLYRYLLSRFLTVKRIQLCLAFFTGKFTPLYKTITIYPDFIRNPALFTAGKRKASEPVLFCRHTVLHFTKELNKVNIFILYVKILVEIIIDIQYN